MLPREFNGFLVKQNSINFLTENQVNALSIAFQRRFDNAKTDLKRKQYGRQYLIFLILRFTGARLSEVTSLNYEDLYFRNAEVKLITLKRYNKANNYRIVPITPNAMSKIATYIAQYPEMKDKLFKLNSSFFYRVFKERCEEAGIPRDLAHPHILRHTRAIELLINGVPVTIVLIY